MSCPFCNLNKEKTRIIKETKSVLVVLSNPRLMPGHLLIIPRRHIEKIAELTKSERKDILETAIEFQEKILAKVASGCDICQHFRPFIPQSNLKINHLHLHIRPRKSKDNLYKTSQRFEKFKKLNNKEIEQYTKILTS